jgi:outer membrane receptor protein involved in Fe transport
MKKYVLAVSIPVVLFVGEVHAQTGKISGVVKSNDSKGLDGASVSLLKAKDSSLVKLAVADKAGAYEFLKVVYGRYLIKAEALGHQKFTGKVFEVTDSRNSIVNDEITLSAVSTVLKGVNVTTVRPPIENRIDKTVVNVEASPTNTGLTAMEVLEKSPGITIDNNGNISLKGKQGVIILIDGKPAYLSGENLTNYLKNMSANQLDQIEIMTQPSAKYDASGNSGIINLKTKKNHSSGFNGNISTTAIVAKYFKNTNSINLNWHKGNINLFGNYGYSYWEGFNDLILNRDSRVNKQTPFDRHVEQATSGHYSGRPQNFKVGVDWSASKKTTLGFVLTGNLQDDKFTSSSRANIFDSLHNFVQYNDARSQTHNPWTNLGYNLNFLQKLDTAGKELSADADYIFFRTKGQQYSNNYLFRSDKTPSEDPYLLNGFLPADIDIYSFKSDYKHPINKTATFEAGIKASYVKTDNDAQYTNYSSREQKWLTDSNRSNHFIYKENINAAYVNLQKQAKKWGIQVGLRAEQTIADGNQVTKLIAFHKNYTKLFPTSYISYKVNDKSTFGVSYGRRIQRPGYQSLNPFQYQLDRYTYRQGNPNLQPQFSHNIELSYNYKGQLNLAANYTTIADIMSQVLITKKEPADSNYTTFLTDDNIASSKTIGFSVSYNKQLKKWWTINAFANVFNNHYKGVIDNEPIDVKFTAFNTNFSSQFNLAKGWSAEVSGFYNSKNVESSAGVSSAMGMFSVGAGKKVLKGRGSIRLNVRDPFYLLHYRSTTELNKGATEVNAKWDNRRLNLTLNYNFGKAARQQRRRTSGAEEESSRIKTGSSN